MSIFELESMKDKVDSKRVKNLNDLFRMTFTPKLGEVVMTSGVAELTEEKQRELIMKVQNFKDFDEFVEGEESNNPYGENDFGKIDLSDEDSFFFKIDYYDLDKVHGSERPDIAGATVRVMTIMCCSEY